jgi:alpha-glucosidase
MTLALPAPGSPAAAAVSAPWWRNPVVYQVYVRSFADSNGDGIGDLAGLRSRLPYLAGLGVDAIWLTPHYVSGGADGGYDVADYRAVDPDLGTVADVRALVGDAHAHGLRVLLDIVPNHTSHQHVWFQAALADPDSEHASKYHFAPPSEDPPNNWVSLFGGPAWSRTPDGRWYLHLFAPQQPDLNWDDPAVAADFEDTLRFWLDMGVDGFRVDVAYGLFKDPDLRDNPGTYSPTLFGHGPEQAMTWNQPRVHDVWRSWRAIIDSYPGERMLVGEVCLADLDQVALYTRPDEMHQAFAFRAIKSRWDAREFEDAITPALDAFASTGAPVAWVLGNHDKDRMVTRFGGGDVGASRARAAALLLLSLPGAAYLYAGDELGLPQAHVPDDAKQDPIFFNSGGARVGRDGCRVPLPWTTSTADAYGFSPTGDTAPWLPQPAGWGEYAASVQDGDPASTLGLHREALALRAFSTALREGAGAVGRVGDLLTVTRWSETDRVECWVNMGEDVAVVVTSGAVMCASDTAVTASAEGVVLPPGTAVWLSIT